MNGRRKGLSLVELLIALVVTTMVLFALFEISNFSWRVSGITRNKAQIQEDLRKANERITKEVRWATEMEIMDDLPNSFSDYEDCYFIALDSSSIIFYGWEKEANATKTREVLNFSAISRVNFILDKDTFSENVLTVHIESTMEGQEITTYVRLPNLEKITGQNYGSVVRFSKP